jgi:hypothetical protein
MPLSTIFQLYRSSQFYWWRKAESLENWIESNWKWQLHVYKVTSPVVSCLTLSNFGSSPATVGIKNGADLGTFGGSLGYIMKILLHHTCKKFQVKKGQYFNFHSNSEFQLFWDVYIIFRSLKKKTQQVLSRDFMIVISNSSEFDSY